jgi:hypothetical protein
MAALGTKLRTIEGGRLGFWCPGCEEPHMITVDGTGAWTWNGNIESPTFSPSILVQCGHYAPGRANPESCWCTYNAEHPDDPSGFICYACHSFVTDGKIQFLADSTHKLSGQTVDLPEWE